MVKEKIDRTEKVAFIDSIASVILNSLNDEKSNFPNSYSVFHRALVKFEFRQSLTEFIKLAAHRWIKDVLEILIHLDFESKSPNKNCWTR